MRNARKLLRWYERAGRDLPWRRTRDPYAIWISEVMLQQTRVETVLPYYERFMERFPSVEVLAAAELEEVLGQWSGLGYYRRARWLHQAARRIAQEGGEFPRSLEGLRALPGVGTYTAAAVASIAFGVAEPVLDGNVVRVLARRLALSQDPRRAPTRRRLLTAARALLDPARPGDSNQALMELGSTICRPRAPDCVSCPLSEGCRGRERGDPERYPPPKPRRRTQRIQRLALMARRGNRLLLVQRPEQSALLAGLWELPWVEIDGGRPEKALAARYGGSWSLGSPLGRLRHGITHRVLEVELLEGTLRDGSAVAEGVEAGWFGPAELESLPVSSLVTKALRAAAPVRLQDPEPRGPAGRWSRRRPGGRRRRGGTNR